ncbi:MAG: HAD-IIIA family hydrolase [Coriobacteriaceae bacterium]|nr:HAD-IIIA family hydrolase [Coriobacteriaceae bacterium]
MAETERDYDTVIFDMDGTLLDTVADLQVAANYALKRAGLPEVDAEATRYAAGYGAVGLMEKLSEGELADDKAALDKLVADFRGYYSEHNTDQTKPYDGVEEMLATLKQAGAKMGIVSNKVHGDTEALRKIYFDDTIPLAIGLNSAMPRKPDPKMLNSALELLGSSAERTLYVGDSEPDVQIAKNAGCTSVACTWGFRSRAVLEAEDPDYIIDHPSELVAIIDKTDEDEQAS